MEDSNIAFVLKYLVPERQMDSNIAPTDNIKGKCLPQKRERCSLKQPQFIGDGAIIKQCKTCNHLVGVRTLICDKCEEAFHISCLEEKVEQEDIDNWYCSPCQAYISQNEPPEYECKVCNGSRYQAEVPQDSPDMSTFLSVALPEDEWKVTNWQPAEFIPATGAKLASMQKYSLHERGDMTRWSNPKETPSPLSVISIL